MDTTEVVTATLGLTTRQAILEFQSVHPNLTTNGTVDEATAVSLLDSSARAEQRLYVFGSIQQPNGSVGANLVVTVSDRGLRREQSLARTESDANGYYHCQYLSQQLLSPSNGADLVVRVLRGQDILYNPSVDQIVYGAPSLTVVNISLTVGDTEVEDEYTTMVTTIRPWLVGQNIGIADLQQNATVQDITFISNATSLDQSKLVNLVLANKLEAQYQIQPQFFYALLAEKVLTSISPTSVTGIRLAIGLSTDPQTLLYDIVLLPSATVTAAVQSAVAGNLTNKALLDSLPAIQKQLLAHTADAQNFLQENPAESQIMTLISQNLANGVIDAAAAVIQSNSYGELGTLLDNLRSAMTTSTLSSDLKSTSATQASGPVAGATQAAPPSSAAPPEPPAPPGTVVLYVCLPSQSTCSHPRPLLVPQARHRGQAAKPGRLLPLR